MIIGNLKALRLKSYFSVIKMSSFSRKRTLITSDRQHLPFNLGPYPVIGFHDVMIGNDRDNSILMRLLYPVHDQTIDVAERCREWPNWYPHDNYRVGYFNVGNWKLTPFIKFFHYLTGDVHIPILQDLQPLKKQMPVIIFSHGVGSCRTTYSGITSQLASYGFLVAVLEHRDGTACCTLYPSSDTTKDEENIDLNNQLQWLNYTHMSSFRHRHSEARNEQINQRMTEVRLAIDTLNQLNNGQRINNVLGSLIINFKSLFDMNNLIMMGHSFGAATTIRVMASDDRFKLGICLDSWMYPVKDIDVSDIKKPILFINMESFQTKASLKKMKQFLDDDDSKRVIKIINSNHADQTDFLFILRNSLLIWMYEQLLLKWMFKINCKADYFMVHDLSVALSVDFIMKHLNNVKFDNNTKSIINEIMDNYKNEMTEGIDDSDLNDQKFTFKL